MPVYEGLQSATKQIFCRKSERFMTDKNKDDSHELSDRSRDENETHRGWKSKWVESTPPRADDPVDEDEMKGHDILDNSPGDRAKGTT
jgi:hypothetical protein